MIERKTIYPGGAVKALGEGRVGGWLVKFNEVDQQKDMFLADSDYGLDTHSRLRVVSEHGLGKLGPKRIGTVSASLKSEGIWIEGTLDTRDDQVAPIYRNVERGLLAWSSGSCERLVQRKDMGSYKAITSWPLIEASLSNRAISPTNKAVALKAWPGEADPAGDAGGEGEEMGGCYDSAIKSFRLLGLEGPGEFLSAVRRSQRDSHSSPTPELMAYYSACKSLGLNESTDSEGGVLVPPGWSREIWRSALALGDSPLARCYKQFTDSNTYYTRAWADDDRTDGQRSGGLSVGRISEGGQFVSSAPRLRLVGSRLLKKAIYIEASDEVVEDTPSLLDDLTPIVGEELAFMIIDEMINGTGAGTLKGVTRAACKIRVPAESGQASGTIVAKNVVNMFGRMYGAARYTCVWHCNVDVDVNLLFLTMPGDTTTAALINYQPPGTVPGSPYAHACGRPIVPLEQCPTLGTEGDLILANWPDYTVVGKTGGIRQTVSAHVKFDRDMQAFKWTWRVDGAPLWAQTRTPAKGTTPQSPFVTLATR